MIKNFNSFINESRSEDLKKAKKQFLELLNRTNIKNHWMKFEEVGYALYQMFCDENGYDAISREQFKKGSSSKSRKSVFLNKYQNGFPIFTIDTLNGWFKEWRDHELTKDKYKKYKGMKFPYIEFPKQPIDKSPKKESPMDFIPFISD